MKNKVRSKYHWSKTMNKVGPKSRGKQGTYWKHDGSDKCELSKSMNEVTRIEGKRKTRGV